MKDKEIMDEATRTNNRRLALVLGLIALAVAMMPFFYISNMVVSG